MYDFGSLGGHATLNTGSHESGHFEWRKKGETVWTKKEIQCLSFTCFMSIVTSFKVFAQ